jgi:hypothetical protein
VLFLTLQSCKSFSTRRRNPPDHRCNLCNARQDILKRPSNAEMKNFALPQTHCAFPGGGYEQLLAQCCKQTGRPSLQKFVLVLSGLDTGIKVSIVANIHRASRFLNPVFLRYLSGCTVVRVSIHISIQKLAQGVSDEVLSEDTRKACCMACRPSSVDVLSRKFKNIRSPAPIDS